MPRGQYDRSAAKAKRAGNSAEFAANNMAAYETIPAMSAANPPWGEIADAEPLQSATDAQLTHMMDTHLRVADVQQPAPRYTRPGFPYENTPNPMMETRFQFINKATGLPQLPGADHETEVREFSVPVEPMTGADDLKVRLAVAEALNAKYAALLKRNGLWLDE